MHQSKYKTDQEILHEAYKTYKTPKIFDKINIENKIYMNNTISGGWDHSPFIIKYKTAKAIMSIHKPVLDICKLLEYRSDKIQVKTQMRYGTGNRCYTEGAFGAEDSMINFGHMFCYEEIERGFSWLNYYCIISIAGKDLDFNLFNRYELNLLKYYIKKYVKNKETIEQQKKEQEKQTKRQELIDFVEDVMMGEE